MQNKCCIIVDVNESSFQVNSVDTGNLFALTYRR